MSDAWRNGPRWRAEVAAEAERLRASHGSTAMHVAYARAQAGRGRERRLAYEAGNLLIQETWPGPRRADSATRRLYGD